MDGIPTPSDALRLGDLTVVPSLNRVARDGRERDVEPRVMAVLVALAETPGEVVTRAVLMESVWPDTVVGDEALTRAVSELRKVLADGAIETIRGTGYRLVVPVEPLSHSTSARPPTPSRGGGGTESEPRRGKRRVVSALAVVALTVAALALVVAVWAAWPRVARSPEADAVAPRVDSHNERDEPFRRFQLDSTSSYFREGMSEFGVYYDSSADRHFSFDTTLAE